jgi:hypothetical protein
LFGLTLKVSEKGGFSLYGKAFIRENDSRLKTKE